jgi:hypothetical protein
MNIETSVVLYDGTNGPEPVSDYDREYLGHRGWKLNEKGDSLAGWTDFFFTWKDTAIIKDCKLIGGEDWYRIEWTDRDGNNRTAWYPHEQLQPA